MPSMFRRVLLTATLATAPLTGFSASAGGLFDFDPAPGGFYVSGFGGINFGGDADFEGVQAPEPGVPGVAGANALASVDFGSSRTFGGAIGAQLPFRYWGVFQPRIEIEGSTFRQTVDTGSFNGGNQTFGGSLSGTAIYFNNYSDILFSDNQVLVPYIGGGIGVVFAQSDIDYFPGTATVPTFRLTNSDTALSTHIAGGLSVRFSQKLELYTEARYTTLYSVDFDRRFIANDGFSANVEDNRINNVSVVGGVRFRF